MESKRQTPPSCALPNSGRGLGWNWMDKKEKRPGELPPPSPSPHPLSTATRNLGFVGGRFPSKLGAPLNQAVFLTGKTGSPRFPHPLPCWVSRDSTAHRPTGTLASACLAWGVGGCLRQRSRKTRALTQRGLELGGAAAPGFLPVQERGVGLPCGDPTTVSTPSEGRVPADGGSGA